MAKLSVGSFGALKLLKEQSVYHHSPMMIPSLAGGQALLEKSLHSLVMPAEVLKDSLTETVLAVMKVALYIPYLVTLTLQCLHLHWNSESHWKMSNSFCSEHF